MKTPLLNLCLLFLAATLHAMPARRGQWRTITLADGSEVRAELRGDAFVHFFQDAEGVRYTRQPHSAFYEVADGASLAVRRAAPRRSQGPARRTRAAAARRIGIGASHAPLTGTHRELIILVNFADCAFEAGHDRALYERLLNTEHFADASLGFTDGSVRDYFLDQSDGLFTMDFDVVGPVTLPHPYAYYGRNDTYYDQDQNPEQMIIDAVRAVDADVDFSLYDNDADGYVDQVFVLYAGKNESAGGGSDTVWPHKYNLSYSSASGFQPLTLDGVKVDDYACSSELTWTGIDETYTGYTFGLAGIGAICHEFSHCLGLPDVYDVAYENYGMNTWSIMDSGEWNGLDVPGYTPPAYTAYERMYCGWRQPTELRTDTLVRGMKPITRGGETFIIRNPAHPSEYYLLENRQVDGWDRALDFVEPTDKLGLLVTHVDFDPTVWEYNEVNCTNADYSQTGNTHQRLHVVAADNSYASDKVDPVTGYTYYDYQDVRDDAFPQGGKDSLTNTSIPRANLYNINTDGRKLLNVGILNICQQPDGTVDFDFRASAGEGTTTEEEVFFYESFDQCAGTGGNDGLWGGAASIGSSTLRTDNPGWSTGNAYGADRCARFGGSRGASVAQTPEFGISGTVELNFLAAPWDGDGQTLNLSIYSADDDAANFRLGQTTFDLTPGQWTACRTTLTGDGKLQLRFQQTARRFFLDEVRVQTPGTGDTVGSIAPASPAGDAISETQTYDLAGRRTRPGQGNTASHGIIVQGKRKVAK